MRPSAASALVLAFVLMSALQVLAGPKEMPADPPDPAADVFISQIKEKSAFASFHSVDPTGCIVTDVYVFGSELAVHTSGGGPTPAPLAAAWVFVFDVCRQALLVRGQGLSSVLTYQTARDLSSASLVATSFCFDIGSGAAFYVDVSLTWTATGEPVHGARNSRFTTPGLTVNTHVNGTFRPAQATGTVTDGSTNFTPNPSFGAAIEDLTTGEVAIQFTPAQGGQNAVSAPNGNLAPTSARPSTWGQLKVIYR